MTGQSIWQGHEPLAEHTPHTRTFIVQVVVLNTVPQRTEPALTLLTDNLSHGAAQCHSYGYTLNQMMLWPLAPSPTVC